jgi:hypothetical protein
MCLSRLTQVLLTPSIKGVVLALRFKSSPGARTLWIRVLISVSSNSFEKERSGQLGPEYIHIVITHRWSG